MVEIEQMSDIMSAYHNSASFLWYSPHSVLLTKIKKHIAPIMASV